MTEALTELGLAVGARLLAPLACWSALAALAEGLFHAAPRVPADVRLPVRRALLLSLPLALALPFVAGALVPSLESEVVRGALAPFALPEIAVGAPVQGDASAPAVSGWTLAGGFVALSLAAALLSGLRLAAALVVLDRRHRALVPADEETVALATALAADAGVSRRLTLATGPADGSPYTMGVRRPVVVLPAGLDADARRLALAHELAHVRRHDFAWTVAERAALAVGAAHPLAHVVAAGAAVDRECLADAEVLRAAPARRRAYADLLLRLADRPAPTLAVGAASPSPLKHRLLAMHRPLSSRALRRARAAGRALALSLVAVTVLVGAADVPASTPASTPAEAFRIANATVTLDGVGTTFRGSVSTGEFAAFGIHVPGVGRVLVGTEPFPGANPAGQVEGDRLMTAAPGHSLVIVSDAPILSSGGRRSLYSRFDLDGTARLAPGFEVSMGISMSSAGLERRFDASLPAVPAASPARADTTMPELIGGLAALQQAVVYPRIQRAAGIEGRSILQFVVGEDGAPRDLEVARSSGDEALDAAALAAVERMRFRPGTVEGRPVPVRFAVPITFRLGDAPVGDRSSAAIVQPELVGGLAALQEATVYPEVQYRAGVEGTAFVQFVVNEAGAVRDIKVARSSGDEGLDAAAVAAVQSVTFRPGTTAGRPTPVQFVVPVRFELPDAD